MSVQVLYSCRRGLDELLDPARLHALPTLPRPHELPKAPRAQATVVLVPAGRRAKGGTAALQLQQSPLPPGARHSRSHPPCHCSSSPCRREIWRAEPAEASGAVAKPGQGLRAGGSPAAAPSTPLRDLAREALQPG